MNRSILMLLCSVSLMASCNNVSQSGDERTKKLSSMTHDTENPTSIFLTLLDKTVNATTISYVAKGIYKNDTVGLLIEVDKDIPAGINADGSVNEAAGFKKGAIKFIKSGAESDRFVAALGELWQVNDVAAMKSAIEPLVFSSNKKAFNEDKPSTNNFKLFFDEEAPIPGELFFTLDTYKHLVQFQEKNAQYRSQIVHAFAE
ncbi:hypothetical protein [Parapedobacter koreensis]|uniref:Uncharacterized protein n=1 Tax=Parapedobacter koreensis TaxID=332977 RepID=A0A1H7EWD5_9SPHI|nr:hypothetical protein [Parapedobacter koreensis]SEK18171.1 hypothetical protein SAMN05421740_10175 [Parapedobacter koreensis]